MWVVKERAGRDDLSSFEWREGELTQQIALLKAGWQRRPEGHWARGRVRKAQAHPNVWVEERSLYSFRERFLWKTVVMSGGEVRQGMLSSIFYSIASSFCALLGHKSSAPLSVLTVPIRNKLKPSSLGSGTSWQGQGCFLWDQNSSRILLLWVHWDEWHQRSSGTRGPGLD